MKVLIALLLLISSATKATEIKVMQIDTGVNYHHDMIVDHVRLAVGDDWIDNHGHGTHVAGIILKGVCSEVRLYSCKFYDTNAMNKEAYLNCLRRAADEHMDFVNYSGGGEEFDPEEFDLFKKLVLNNVTVVVAAGNMNPMTKKVFNLGSPCYGFFPACLRLTNMIIVGNLFTDGSANSNSNYGLPEMVWEIGTKIKSADRNNIHGTVEMSGTSMATAIRTNKLLKKKCLEILQ